jgi:hypothetical protein
MLTRLKDLVSGLKTRTNYDNFLEIDQKQEQKKTIV